MNSRFIPAATIAVLLIAVRFANAQTFTVNFDGGPGLRDLVTADASAVPDGNLVEIGYFASGFDVPANAGDLSALRDAWTLFASTPVQTIFGEPGRFSGSEDSSDDSFTGNKIYLWTFKTTGNAAPEPDLSDVEQYGLYSSTSPAWVFPSRFELPPANTTTITSSDVDQIFFGNADSEHLTLAPVPEPAQIASAAGMVLLCFAALRRFRRC